MTSNSDARANDGNDEAIIKEDASVDDDVKTMKPDVCADSED